MDIKSILAQLLSGGKPILLYFADTDSQKIITAAKPFLKTRQLMILHRKNMGVLFAPSEKAQAEELLQSEITPQRPPISNIVLIGFIGSKLDAGGRNQKRWQKWRPSVAIHQQDVTFKRCEYFMQEICTETGRQIVHDVEHFSPETEINLLPIDFENPWDFAEVYGKLFDWAKSYPFDPDRETYWVNITTGTHVVQICLFLLVGAHIIPAKLVQISPPHNQKRNIPKGNVGSYEVIDLNLARYDALADRLARVQEDAVAYLKSGIKTRNPVFNQMIHEIEQVALNSPAPILLTGATGAGKSMLAKRIFELKKARHLISGRLVDVNCATLRGDSAAAALFGHTKGAFTGAAGARKGLLKSADGGILFLDEIGELGLDEQAMLLKAIEEKQYFPLGSDEEVSSDFQLIAGTNRDLGEAVIAGEFREDLYARINIWHYRLPGLKERREDIAPNIEHQLAVISAEFGRRIRFSAPAWETYLQFAESDAAVWYGNFRDLAASILRLSTLAKQGVIEKEQVFIEIERLKTLWQGLKPKQDARERELDLLLKGREIDNFERTQLQYVIQVCRESKNLAEAGRKLFNISRLEKENPNDSDRLRKYLAKYGISWHDL